MNVFNGGGPPSPLPSPPPSLLMIVNDQLESLTSSNINVTGRIPFKLPYDGMDSQEKDNIILKLYQEIGNLERAIHALETERDHLSQALLPSRARVDSPTNDGYLSDSIDSSQYEEYLVSDDTLQGYESGDSVSTESVDSNSIFFPQRCGTPCSAPSNFHSISDEVPESSTSFQRKRHSSLPSTGKQPTISQINYDQVFSADDAESLGVTSYEEQCDVQFPQVGDDYAETPQASSMWCTRRRDNIRCRRSRPRQCYELNAAYLSFSTLWHDFGPESAHPIQQPPLHRPFHSETDEMLPQPLIIPDIVPEEDILLTPSTNVPYMDVELDETDLQMLHATDYTSDTTNDIDLNGEVNLKDSECQPLQVINVSVPVSHPSFVTPAEHILDLNVNTWSFLPVTPRNKYMRRTFNPSLPRIPEDGEYMMQVTDLELCFAPARLTKMPPSIVNSRSRTNFDDTLRSKERKTWFEMVMEDEEYD